MLPAQIVDTVLHKAESGSIVLFHANGRGWHTAEALPETIHRLRQQGFQFVTVKELINAPGATLDIRRYCFDAKIGDTERYDALARRLDVKFREFTARFRSGAGPARASEKKTNGKPEDDGAGFMELPERNPAFHDISEGAEVSPRSDEPWR